MEIEITILKFNDVSRRKELKRPTWFAIDNDILSHPDFFDINAEEFRCWVWIISVASKVNKDTVRLDSRVFAHQCRCKEKVFFATIEKLRGKRIHDEIQSCHDEIQSCHDDVHEGSSSLHTLQTLHTNTTDTTADRLSPPAICMEAFAEPFLKEFIEKVPIKVQSAWLTTYSEKEWIIHQLREAVTWIHGHQHKAPKSNFSRFFTGWLSRNWEKHRKNISSNEKTNGPKMITVNLP